MERFDEPRLLVHFRDKRIDRINLGLRGPRSREGTSV